MRATRGSHRAARGSHPGGLPPAPGTDPHMSPPRSGLPPVTAPIQPLRTAARGADPRAASPKCDGPQPHACPAPPRSGGPVPVGSHSPTRSASPTHGPTLTPRPPVPTRVTLPECPAWLRFPPLPLIPPRPTPAVPPPEFSLVKMAAQPPPPLLPPLVAPHPTRVRVPTRTVAPCRCHTAAPHRGGRHRYGNVMGGTEGGEEGEGGNGDIDTPPPMAT